MTKSNGEAEAARLERAVDAYIERVEGLSGDLLEVAPAEGEWTVKQLSAHCAEIYVYWANAIDGARRNPGKPFGRTVSDPLRIAYVEEHQCDPLPELLRQIRLGEAQAASALRAFSMAEWETVTGVHETRGVMAMDFISNLLLAGHAEEHLAQLDETLVLIERRLASGDTEIRP